MYGSTLSSAGDADLTALNPYLARSTLDLVGRLVVATMLRANRVGHANRCLGAGIALLALVDAALATRAAGGARSRAGATLLPRLAQASGELGEGLGARRHFVDPAGLGFDPRFLVFE